MSRPAVIGPLPLSGASPDGGIFAYPNGKAKGFDDPFWATSTIATAGDSLDQPDTRARGRRNGSWLPVPRDTPGDRPSITSPFGLDLAGTPSATGLAFLPPAANLAQTRVTHQSRKAGASRWPILYSRMKPNASLATLIMGSASLFLGLVAPDCVTRLTALQDDRRWKRQWTFNDPKRKPDPAREV